MVWKTNKARRPQYVVVLERKKGKNRAEKVHFLARFFRAFYRWHRVFLIMSPQKHNFICENPKALGWKILMPLFSYKLKKQLNKTAIRQKLMRIYSINPKLNLKFWANGKNYLNFQGMKNKYSRVINNNRDDSYQVYIFEKLTSFRH